MSAVDEIFAVYMSRGSNAYGGERVSQLEHALQTALLAEQSGADSPLIVASLLHDYGHLIHKSGAGAARHVNYCHEALGAENLAAFFGDAVTVPIRLHVEAKRFLCGIAHEYAKILSPASSRSLELQGGSFTAGEADAFIQRPFAADAVKLRRWDESAKQFALRTPDLEYFRPHLEACLFR